MDDSEHGIVIVGAGPTGLALGAELKRIGVSSLILDRLAVGANTSRAAVIHARTLEVLEPLGVTAELLKEGIVIPTFRIRDRSRILASVSFADLHTKYPFTLMCPQDCTEAILARRLESLGGVVQRPCEVVEIRPGENEVEVQFKSGGEVRTMHAQWVVGCDGMHSIVREQAAIPFLGGAYEESFVLADVEMDWPLGREEVNLFFSGDGLVVVAPLPGNHFRIVASVTEAPPEPSIADFQQILEERGPEKGAMTIHRMAWSSRFHVQHRIAKSMRQGRVLLAGDAAHVHSPAGGQGMNTGIQDAIALAGALKVTLQGNVTALDAWEEKRLEIAHSVVKMTDRMTKMATASSSGVKILRNAVVSIIGHIPFAQHALAEKLSELDNR
ncbi:FAD-dependent monooxygenase [Pedosphaera parvula]|uniref:Monooxygenase FAD-binding n=1 Tax=Pedosphaera parvula (strain Ellin514) TaxID=320771 RepID=B9XFQ4_PEDPL|nr:FAD-dependent monooxygenase [Pedosphaera parvula]EEF61418.1 monooxygenase FAD-binding [Pedosphaera parvula Ellin514]